MLKFKQMKKYQLLLSGVFALLLSACALLEPENDNHSTFDRV